MALGKGRGLPIELMGRARPDPRPTARVSALPGASTVELEATVRLRSEWDR